MRFFIFILWQKIKNHLFYILTKFIYLKHFVLFSDDVKWCEGNFKRVNGIEIYNSGNDIEDLKHMAEYRYMIIANSSYSLFASLINDKECVIAPKHESWFGKGVNLKTSDLLPERFIQI